MVVESIFVGKFLANAVNLCDLCIHSFIFTKSFLSLVFESYLIAFAKDLRHQ